MSTALDDAAFDALVPARWRARSALHFTPAAVARRAAALLAPAPGGWVLDVGAGVGKFCLLAAAVAPDAVFVGVERRAPLVRVARRLAARLGAANVHFVHGDATEVDWGRFDAFYLFNPFAEHLRGREPLDATLALDPASFHHYVAEVRARLALARPGTRVCTYHGFGGDPPAGWALEVDEPAGTDRLELWVKRGRTRPAAGRASCAGPGGRRAASGSS